MTPPTIFDNDNTPDLNRWLATVPSFASDWPRGVLSAAQTQDGPATAAVDFLSIHSSKIAVSE
jgi:hypothetical protein